MPWNEIAHLKILITYCEISCVLFNNIIIWHSGTLPLQILYEYIKYYFLLDTTWWRKRWKILWQMKFNALIQHIRNSALVFSRRMGCLQTSSSQKKASFNGHEMSFIPPFRCKDPQCSLPPALSGCLCNQGLYPVERKGFPAEQSQM